MPAVSGRKDSALSYGFHTVMSAILRLQRNQLGFSSSLKTTEETLFGCEKVQHLTGASNLPSEGLQPTVGSITA